jgi:hypothetical protein
VVELTERLVVDESSVAGKVMDGEAIIIDLSTGVYYSADKVGGFIWSQIEGGSALGDIVDAVCAQYVIDPDQAKADVFGFVSQLVDANLVSTEPVNGTVSTADRAGSIEKIPYETPVLVPYEEMADLLALDPPMPLFGKEANDESS